MVKYLGINLTIDMKDMCNENSDTDKRKSISAMSEVSLI